MAGMDYICCGMCDTKLVYHGGEPVVQKTLVALCLYCARGLKLDKPGVLFYTPDSEDRVPVRIIGNNTNNL